ncbi:Similar to nol11: Nucleolar protein 11 (Xenopus laevis) [Cotesia congregata]|uniref:Similar to nol11: Nucleolar protein 11 (Xenopus laevis) n=1 Tax=Cotesia congregata TaxID=51543 RepID=A0A8J2HKP2_COTCN|nr:Similar to nol11: Nucleolar protein 11 (Xenopus laevis) [Cotesia congregata]
MAKLYSYYTLCPLNDQQSLLGVEKDVNPGCAIITLDRNIAIRYKLHDSKQLNSWSSKKKRFTSQVIYDRKNDRYAAIFNEKYLEIWDKDEKSLDNLKKYNFNDSLYGILTLENDSSILVKQNGATASLNWALDNRDIWSSNKGFLRSNEKFIDWSHGRLYKYPLTCPSSEPAPGNVITVFSFISTNNPVAMISLNKTTIAIYGADANEEGAVLLIYNIEYKLVEASQKLKLYTKNAKLWCIDDKLLLAANRSLSVAQFKLASQKMNTMLGSSLKINNNFSIKNKNNNNNNNNEKDSKPIDNDENDNDNDIIEVREAIIVDWENLSSNTISGSPIKLSTSKNDFLPINLTKQINGLLNEGVSDATIHQTLMPQLIQQKDVKSILWCMDNFKDLPEQILVDLLAFGLRTSDETFLITLNGTTCDDDDDNDDENIFKTTRNLFLDKIFQQNFSDLSLLAHIKTTLTFTEILTLINNLIDKLNLNKNDFIDKTNDKHLYEWASIFIDSHYQHYLLSQDSQVVIVLERLHTIIDNHFEIVKDLQDLRPILLRIMNGKSLKSPRKYFNKFYSIEQVKLY